VRLFCYTVFGKTIKFTSIFLDL